MNRKRKILIIVGSVPVGVVLLALLGYTMLNIMWGGQLRREMAALKAAGAPVSFEEIKLKPTADKDNSAIELRKVFGLITNGTFSMKRSGGLTDSWKKIETTWTKYKSPNPNVKLVQNSEKNVEACREVINSDEGKQVFALLEKAATKPKMDYDLDYTEGASLLIPHLSYMRFISRLTCVKSELELLDGQREKAWRNIINGLKISIQMKDESIIISQLVWIAISSNYCSFAKDNLLKYGINDAQAKEMIQLLDKQGEEYLPGMQKAIQAERIIYGFTIFEKAINEGMTKRERDSMSLSGRMPIAPVLKRDYAEYLKVMRSYEKDFNKPYFKLEESIEKKGKRLRKEIPSICVLTKMLTPALSSCRTKLARIIVYTDATKIRLALEIYKNKHGGYPEKLSELTPAILPKLPLSDLTGKPFEYEKNETSYELKTGLEKKEN